MTRDAIGRQVQEGRALNGDFVADRRTRAVTDFMFLMQYRRDLREARELIAQAYPGNETRLDPDIAQANLALRAAALELEASRPEA